MIEERAITRSNRFSTVLWLLLLGLTFVTYAIGMLGLSGTTITVVLLVMAVLKGQMVADHFMGLSRVKPLWRTIVLLYLLLVCGLIGLAYTLGLANV